MSWGRVTFPGVLCLLLLALSTSLPARAADLGDQWKDDRDHAKDRLRDAKIKRGDRIYNLAERANEEEAEAARQMQEQLEAQEKAQRDGYMRMMREMGTPGSTQSATPGGGNSSGGSPSLNTGYGIDQTPYSTSIYERGTGFPGAAGDGARGGVVPPAMAPSPNMVPSRQKGQRPSRGKPGKAQEGMGAGAVPDMAPNALSQEETVLPASMKVRDLESKLQDLRGRYTDHHPDVELVRQALEKARAEEASEAAKSTKAIKR